MNLTIREIRTLTAMVYLAELLRARDLVQRPSEALVAKEVIATLSSEAQDLLTGVYEHGLSVRDIARRKKKTQQIIYNQVANAEQQFYKALTRRPRSSTDRQKDAALRQIYLRSFYLEAFVSGSSLDLIPDWFMDEVREHLKDGGLCREIRELPDIFVELEIDAAVFELWEIGSSSWPDESGTETDAPALCEN